ncbi:glycosyltransferase family 4 protein [Mangrovimonas xylaniphaga]|uniref:glycosyltransferase family 4 protein n=1 Tax=Mangrovimonas xylaniphaga TaxID=1645915 RepID=UPI0006B531B3|nr:glycosyltransferase family 4 protein [Mangrovimonas xylaniphaga]
MRVLFITHDASRSGAPMVLLHFLKWLKIHHSQIKVDVLALRGGALKQQLERHCDTYFDWELFTKQEPLTLRKRVLKNLGFYKISNKKDLLIDELAANAYDVVYANTVVAMPLGKEITKLSPNSKLIVHVHELEVIIRQLLPNIASFVVSVDHFIVPSELTKQNLVSNFEIPAKQITKVYECSEVTPGRGKRKPSKKIFTIGASGTAHWRKGSDLFLLLANYILFQYPEAKVQFVWVGQVPFHEQAILDADIKKLGLDKNVIFTGEVEDPSVFYSDFDVFVLPSREDPFPLVCIEVGMLGIPIICFDKATGIQEVLEQEGGGFVVPYIDIQAMGDKIMAYYDNSTLLLEHGNLNRISFSKFTPDHICPQLYSVIDKQLSI